MRRVYVWPDWVIGMWIVMVGVNVWYLMSDVDEVPTPIALPALIIFSALIAVELVGRFVRSRRKASR